MPMRVRAPDGAFITFPDGTPDSDIAIAMEQHAAPVATKPQPLQRAMLTPAPGAFQKEREKDVGLMLGAASVPAGIAEWATKAPGIKGTGIGQTLEAGVGQYRAEEAAHQQRRNALGMKGPELEEALGAMLVPIPGLGKLEGLSTAGKIGVKGLEGAFQGALAPTSGKGDFAQEKGMQAATGFAAAAGLTAGGKALESFAPVFAQMHGVSPEKAKTALQELQQKWRQTSKSTEHAAAAEFLLDRGVRLHPGQREGGFAKMLWDTNKKANPYARSGLLDLEKETVEDVNRAAYQEVLKLADPKLKLSGPQVGQVGLDKLGNQLSAEYKKVVPGLTFKADTEVQKEINKARASVGVFGTDAKRRIDGEIATYIAPIMKMKTAKGEDVQKVLSTLDERINDLTGPKSNQIDRDVADRLSGIRDAMAKNVETHSSPETSRKYANLDRAWAAYNTLLDAGGRSKNGTFNTQQLLSAVRSPDKKAFARGRGQLTEFATKANTVLSELEGNPGTALGNAVNTIMKGGGVVGGLVGGMLGGPVGAAVGFPADLALAGLTNNAIKAMVGNRAQQILSGAPAKAPGALNQLAARTGRAVQPYSAQAARGAVNLAGQQQ